MALVVAVDAVEDVELFEVDVLLLLFVDVDVLFVDDDAFAAFARANNWRMTLAATVKLTAAFGLFDSNTHDRPIL